MIIAFTKTIYAPYSRALLPLFIYKMEKVNFKYSIKNIPIPSERAYLLQLMEKIEMFITRMHWKAIYCNSKTNDNSSERYGLKTLKCPKQVKELVSFQHDLIDTLKVIKFRKVKNQFLTKLKNDIKTVKQSKKTLTFVDKTPNMYQLSKKNMRNFLPMQSHQITKKRATISRRRSIWPASKF